MAKAKLVVGAKVKMYRVTKRARDLCVVQFKDKIGVVVANCPDSGMLRVSFGDDKWPWYVPRGCLKVVD